MLVLNKVQSVQKFMQDFFAYSPSFRHPLVPLLLLRTNTPAEYPVGNPHAYNITRETVNSGLTG